MAPCGSRAAPWWGVGRSPMPLTLGGATKRKGTAQSVRRPAPVRARKPERRPQERPQAAACSKIPKVRKAWLS